MLNRTQTVTFCQRGPSRCQTKDTVVGCTSRLSGPSFPLTCIKRQQCIIPRAAEDVSREYYGESGVKELQGAKEAKAKSVALPLLSLDTSAKPPKGPLSQEVYRRGVLAAFVVSVGAFLNTYKDVFHSPTKLFTRVSKSEVRKAVMVVLTHAATLAHFRSQLLQVGLELRAGFRSHQPITPPPIRQQVLSLLDQQVFEEILVSLPIVAAEVVHRQRDELSDYNFAKNGTQESINTVLYETLTQARQAVVKLRKIQNRSMTDEEYMELLPCLKSILDGIEVFLNELHG